jgi:hypothetical protein
MLVRAYCTCRFYKASFMMIMIIMMHYDVASREMMAGAF